MKVLGPIILLLGIYGSFLLWEYIGVWYIAALIPMCALIECIGHRWDLPKGTRNFLIAFWPMFLVLLPFIVRQHEDSKKLRDVRDVLES